jgi:hypothetical protein
LKQRDLRNLNLGDLKRDLRGLKSHPTKNYVTAYPPPKGVYIYRYVFFSGNEPEWSKCMGTCVAAMAGRISGVKKS